MSRKAAIAISCIAATLTGGLIGNSQAASPPDPVFPDLVADAPVHKRLEQASGGQGGTRLLLRFDGFVHNAGQGALEIRGSGPSDGMMSTVEQRVYGADGIDYTDLPLPDAELFFENTDGHNHWHFQRIARYSLWSEDRSAEVAPAMKVGFCLLDSQAVTSVEDRFYADNVNFCEEDGPLVASLFMGVSAGYRDVYGASLPFQWIDVSNLRPGPYWLRSEIDPDELVTETNEQNASTFAATRSTVPGYVARPLSLDLDAATPSTIELGAERFGSPGPVEFRIDSAPAHGTLDVATGGWFSGSSLTYTPAPGHPGRDSFTYSARDAHSQFPLAPVTATVSLGDGPESVAISGAPEFVYTNASAQLSATVLNGRPGVRWSASAGTIDADGTYVAPGSPPPGGVAAITATSASGAQSAAHIAVREAPPAQPAPSGTPGGRGRLSRLRLSRRGRIVFVQVTPRRWGRVTITASAGDRRLGRCTSRLPARRSYICRLRVPRGVGVRDVRFRAELTRGNRTLATRSARFGAGAAQAAHAHDH